MAVQQPVRKEGDRNPRSVEEARPLVAYVQSLFMPSNVDALVAGLTEDCVVRFGVILEFRGRDALRKFFEARRAKQKGYRLNKQFRTHGGRRHAHAAVLNVMSETQHASASKDPDGKSASDCSKSFWAVWLPIFMTASALLGSAVTWGYSQHSAHIQAIEEKIAAARAENESLLREFLVPIQTKLKLNLSTFKQLESEYNIPGSGILESYVIHTRENGEPKKETLQFGLIADLVQRDAEMITLLEGYSLYRLTHPFSEQSDEFLSQAHVYVVRFRALPTIVETGEKLPRAKPFPAGFPDALDEEIRKRRERTPDPDLGAK